MRNVVEDGGQEDRGDGLPRQRKTTVRRGGVRLADGNVAVSGDEHRQSYGCRLSDKDERVRVQPNAIPGHGMNSPSAHLDNSNQIVDGELDQARY